MKNMLLKESDAWKAKTNARHSCTDVLGNNNHKNKRFTKCCGFFFCVDFTIRPLLSAVVAVDGSVRPRMHFCIIKYGFFHGYLSNFLLRLSVTLSCHPDQSVVTIMWYISRRFAAMIWKLWKAQTAFSSRIKLKSDKTTPPCLCQ